jgi:hypothetical protein
MRKYTVDGKQRYRREITMCSVGGQSRERGAASPIGTTPRCLMKREFPIQGTVTTRRFDAPMIRSLGLSRSANCTV